MNDVKALFSDLCLSIFLIGLIAITYGCNNTKAGQERLRMTELPDKDLAYQVISQNQNWKNLVNEDSESLAEIYVPEAIQINLKGNVTSGAEQIITSYKNLIKDWKRIDTIYTVKNIVADNRQRYEYEIGTFINSDGLEYHHLVIWNTTSALKKRELEFVAKSEGQTDHVAQELDQYREKWIQRCNEHNAGVLVEELYTDNAIYYNHKPVVIGTEAITREYGYMNNVDYSLHLEPIVVKPVSPNLAFEIGQCSGSYGGKYVIVWEKNDQNEWMVLLDSNI